MARFVNVDDFKKEIMECNADPVNEFDLGWDTWGIFNAIDRTPTADVQPVIHAHKIYAHSQGGGTHWLVCSNCEKAIDLADVYCRYCGAIMDEEADNG